MKYIPPTKLTITLIVVPVLNLDNINCPDINAKAPIKTEHNILSVCLYVFKSSLDMLATKIPKNVIGPV